MAALVLLVVAAVCFAVAAWGVPTGRVAIGWLGLAFLAVAFILERWPAT